MRWDAARVASRRQLPKPRKMMGPVGERPAPNGELHAALDADDKPFAIACKACGHDVCSCPAMKQKNDGPDCPYCFRDDCAAECRSDAPVPFPCVFCLQTGVHDCPGGEYTQHVNSAFTLGNVWSGRLFPGKVAAEATRGMRPEPTPFTEAFDQKIKTVMQSAELYLTAVDLGIDPSTLPVNIESGQARALKLEASFDDHARHVANHVQTAERLGICGLCHSPDHKFMQCPDRARLYRESLEFYK